MRAGGPRAPPCLKSSTATRPSAAGPRNVSSLHDGSASTLSSRPGFGASSSRARRRIRHALEGQHVAHRSRCGAAQRERVGRRLTDARSIATDLAGGRSYASVRCSRASALASPTVVQRRRKERKPRPRVPAKPACAASVQPTCSPRPVRPAPSRISVELGRGPSGYRPQPPRQPSRALPARRAAEATGASRARRGLCAPQRSPAPGDGARGSPGARRQTSLAQRPANLPALQQVPVRKVLRIATGRVAHEPPPQHPCIPCRSGPRSTRGGNDTKPG